MPTIPTQHEGVEQPNPDHGSEADHIPIPPVEDLFDVDTDQTDFMSAESFPASDPPSHSPPMGPPEEGQSTHGQTE